MSNRVVIVGAGVGGLSAAAILARRGHEVVVLERAEHIGGKLRVESVDGVGIDAGPTVLTMRWALERVFSEAGARLDEHLKLHPLETIARHAWLDGTALDLYADVERTARAIDAAFGKREADGYVRFAAYAKRIWDLVREPFIESQRPTFTSMLGLAAKIGPRAFAAIDSSRTMWRALEGFFTDPRLIQLFGRYATYCGSSPFTAPATLHCISHVEREGVYSVEGGMSRIAIAMAGVAKRAGATIRTGAHVDEIVVRHGAVGGVQLESGELVEAGRVVFNGDVSALSRGLLGRASVPAGTDATKPSLSAVTLAAVGRARGFELARHNVFFSADSPREFAELERGGIPEEPTVYVCAQDREDRGVARRDAERFFVIVNAPAVKASGAAPTLTERAACERKILRFLSRFQLGLEASAPVTTTLPQDFASRFPGTGGAIYGAATTGMWSSFSRAGSRTSIKGLYLAGGSAHPGSGVPMAATSGRLAATSLMEDLRSTGRSRPTAMLGGT